MGKLLDKIFRRNKKQPTEVTYDVNAPISEYTEDQIRNRINEELACPKDCSFSARYQYDWLCYISGGIIRFSGCGTSNVSDELFLNDFFREAVLRKMKRKIYKDLKDKISSSTTVVVTAEMAKEKIEELETAVENHVKRAKEAIQVHKENAENEPMIDKLFSDVIDNQ